MQAYDFSNIVDINNQGVVYIDKKGNRQFIDFIECRRNWVKHVNESKEYITWDGAPYVNISDNDTNCVGQRDWFAKKPYFEFFTQPMVKFELTPQRKIRDLLNKHWKQRYYPEFHRIQLKILDCGWSTFDLG